MEEAAMFFKKIQLANNRLQNSHLVGS